MMPDIKNRIMKIRFADRLEAIFFDSTNRGVPLGRIGLGPGEYVTIAGITTFHDSLLVAHDGSTVSVFDAKGAFIRSFVEQLGIRGAIVVVDSAHVVAAGRRGLTNDERSSSAPLHVLTGEGSYMHSVEVRPVMSTGISEWVLARADSLASRRTYWAAEREGNYRVQRVDLSGQIASTIVRATPTLWNVAAYATRAALDSVIASTGGRDISRLLADQPVHRPSPPRTRISGLHQKGDILWISLTVAAPGWMRVVLKYRGDERSPTEESASRLYQTIIEAIDIDTGSLISRATVNGVGTVLNDGTFARMFYEESGIIRVERFELELVDNRSKQLKGGL